jgi:hypothetical protein
MIRGFFRLVGLLLLAGGFIFMVYDGARWVADQTLNSPFGNSERYPSVQPAGIRAWVEGVRPGSGPASPRSSWTSRCLP